MKRILCIVGSMNAGGAETFLMKMYRNLDRNLYQMDFAVAEKTPGIYDQEIYKLGGKIHYIIPKTKGFIKSFKSKKHSLESIGHFHSWAYKLGKLKISKTQAPQSLGLLC